MLSRTLPLFLVLCAVLPASPAAAAAEGFIHGTVTWPSGETMTGFLRWEGEEACWDDLFHTGYRDNPWREQVDLEKLAELKRKEYYRTHGLLDRLHYYANRGEHDAIGWRMLLIRFGDIVSIEIHDGQDDFMVTADGSRHRIGGYSRDAGSDLMIYPDQGGEPRQVEWNDLTGIVFSPAPPEAVPYAERLHGVVESSLGVFEGFIQWDVSECLSSDILDGSLDGKDHDLAMGDIRAIAPADNGKAAAVTLKSGETLTLDGTNDVDQGNRGIMVENPRWGRVIVPWKRLERVTFSEGHGSGAGRGSYANAGPLRGMVLLRDGSQLSGRLVYDLDEGWRWDIFNGDTAEGLSHNIPFPLIARITPLEGDRCLVRLHDGLELELGDDQDTGQDHGGMLVFSDGSGQGRHVPWADIAAIHFDP